MTGGIFAILDDIALLMDDVTMMSKVATKKTAGILGDDLAVNAEKATGFHASRELPVLWQITKGSFINKLIILPLAFLLSAYAPYLIVPVLLLGGSYLCYEGVEKIFHSLAKLKPRKQEPQSRKKNNEPKLSEKEKIRSAILTDFILSIEIIIIALGTVIHKDFTLQVIVVSLVALIATVGVYGIVGILVRMDDLGFYFLRKSRNRAGLQNLILQQVGNLLVISLPYIIRALAIIGTTAMLLVGGGMFTHNISQIHEIMHISPPILGDFITGLVVGVVLVSIHWTGLKIFTGNN